MIGLMNIIARDKITTGKETGHVIQAYAWTFEAIKESRSVQVYHLGLKVWIPGVRV